MEKSTAYLCPRCSTLLTFHRDGESLWCEVDCEMFDQVSLERLRQWRSMSLEERAAEFESRGDDVLEFFGIAAADLIEVKRFDQQRKAEVLFRADVSPDKEALLSLARGLSTAGALREMIDNSLDCAQRKRGGAPISVTIELDANKGFVRVSDDAGGMTRDELIRCLKLGAQAPGGHAGNVIGKFGVGAKEAIYHFGHEVTISTCDLDDTIPLEVFVPARWLDDPKWEIIAQHGNAIQGTTQIQVGVLETFDFDVSTISRELSETYAKRLAAGKLTVTIDGTKLAAPVSIKKLYPPEFYPRQYSMMVSNVMVDVEVSILDGAPEASGIFFYTFGRRFAHWTWTDPLTRTIFDKPPQHRLNTHFRVDVDFQGNIDDVPINSNKDQVDTTKYAFKPLAKIVSKLASPYLAIISWLSKDNNMGYLRGNYAGTDKPHRSIEPTSPGFSRKIELGKIFETMQLSKPRIADPVVLYSTIAEERKPVASAKTLEGEDNVVLEVVADVASSYVPQKLERNREKPSLPTPTPTTKMLVSLLTNDAHKIEQFRTEIARAADEIGVQHRIS